MRRLGRPVRRGLAGIAVAILATGVYLTIRDRLRGYHTTYGAAIHRFTLHSALVHRDLHEIRVVPPHHAAWTLVLLHGRGSSPSSWLNQPFFDALHALGARAPVVLLLDGGDHSYWHDRADGRWGTATLRQLHGRVAIGGISMGGFGALLLGARAHVCGVGGHSPALWFRGGDTPAGAFDDAADFARNDLIAHPPRYGAPVWIDVGTEDPFHDAASGHDGAYWRAHMRSYFQFYARSCG
jgi:hypothetical protein